MPSPSGPTLRARRARVTTRAGRTTSRPRRGRQPRGCPELCWGLGCGLVWSGQTRQGGRAGTIVRTWDRTAGPLIPKSALSAPLPWTNTRPSRPASVLRGSTCSDGTEALKGVPTSIALSVENIRGHGEEFELCLTFRAGRTYCCCEDMCHTGVFTEKRWRQLRAALAVHGVEPHKPLVVRICTRLEAGARLHYGKSDEPEPEVYDQGPWTLTVHGQSPPVPIHHEQSPSGNTLGPLPSGQH
jgi:hypothetical protein